MCLRSSFDKFAIPSIYDVEGITTMPVPGRRCPACLERGDTIDECYFAWLRGRTKRLHCTRDLFIFHPSANIGNGLECVAFQPGRTLFSIP
ncbi:hypothetical protein B5807_06068 [Epicoccum nigrum]|uniref:Uncharacterized protein n=1 Tax=Epicoccum nigrum TaxID=105696 RepID=A0A1Y2M106_EPING|nr:hypothetical protein B5807_06068 [Epicoccum nigrum]